MDHARCEAIKALFSKGAEPDQVHVEELIKDPHLLADEEDDLLDEDIDTFNNFKSFSNNPAAYIATLKTSHQKICVQRLAGLPEDPMPEPSIEIPKPVTGLTIGNLDDLVLDDETEAQGDARQIGLQNLFDPASKHFSQEDVDAISQRWRLEREDASILSPVVHEQIALFASQVDCGDGEDYIDSIDDVIRPDLSDAERAKLKHLLHQLLNPPNKNPATSSVARPVGDQVVLNLEVPSWIRALHTTERWQKMRQIVEVVFANSRSTNPVVQADGQKRLNAWKLHAKECSEGYSGPNLIAFGEHMLKCVRDLEGGADPTSHIYRVFYINP